MRLQAFSSHTTVSCTFAHAALLAGTRARLRAARQLRLLALDLAELGPDNLVAVEIGSERGKCQPVHSGQHVPSGQI